jgi:hypothetical protein
MSGDPTASGGTSLDLNLDVTAAAPNYTHDQYLRKWTLSMGAEGDFVGTGVGTGTGTAGGELVLTTEQKGYDLRMNFKVRMASGPLTPNTAIITIYNLKAETAQQVVKEFNTVTLQAGYLTGNYGTIFKGTVKQYKRGRESATDTYLIIYAADGDLAVNKAYVNGTLGPGSTTDDLQKVLQNSQKAAQPGLTDGYIQDFGIGGTNPAFVRSRPYWGMAAMEVRTWTRNTNSSWSIQNNQIQIYQNGAYPQGQAVVLNAQTGMIGVPESTQDGINVTCLLNPAIEIGGLVKIDNAGVNQYGLPEYATVTQYNVPGGGAVQGAQFPDYTSRNFYATVANDGLYQVRVIDYAGDTRALEWYNHMICWAIDTSEQPGLPGGTGLGTGISVVQGGGQSGG